MANEIHSAREFTDAEVERAAEWLRFDFDRLEGLPFGAADLDRARRALKHGLRPPQTQREEVAQKIYDTEFRGAVPEDAYAWVAADAILSRWDLTEKGGGDE